MDATVNDAAGKVFLDFSRILRKPVVPSVVPVSGGFVRDIVVSSYALNSKSLVRVVVAPYGGFDLAIHLEPLLSGTRPSRLLPDPRKRKFVTPIVASAR